MSLLSSLLSTVKGNRKNGTHVKSSLMLNQQYTSLLDNEQPELENEESVADTIDETVLSGGDAAENKSETVESTEPAAETEIPQEQPEINVASHKPVGIEGLIREDHGRSGWIDGRYYQTNQIRLEREQGIIGTLLQAIDQRKNDITMAIQALNTQLPTLDPTFMRDTIAQMHAQLTNLESTKAALDVHRELVMEGKGFAAKPLNSYRNAFQRGYKAFLDDNDLLKKHGLF